MADRYKNFISSHLSSILLIIAIPFCLNVFVYFGYVTNSLPNRFHEEAYTNRYKQGNYRYRVLGLKTFLMAYHVIEKINFKNRLWNNAEKNIDKKGDYKFYYTYFIFNTFFHCLTMFMIFLIFRLPYFRDQDIYNHATLMTVSFLIAVSQFLPMPYDNMSYFFISLCIYVFLVVKSRIPKFILLAGTMILATLIRESSCVVLSFIAALYFMKNGFTFKKDAEYLVAAALAFIVVYFGIRFAFGFSRSISHNFSLTTNLNFGCLVGLIYFLSLIWVFRPQNPFRLKTYKYFLLFTLPYTVFLTFAGYFWEVRLWNPVLIPLLIIGRMDIEHYLKLSSEENVGLPTGSG